MSTSMDSTITPSFSSRVSLQIFIKHYFTYVEHFLNQNAILSEHFRSAPLRL